MTRDELQLLTNAVQRLKTAWAVPVTITVPTSDFVGICAWHVDGRTKPLPASVQFQDCTVVPDAAMEPGERLVTFQGH